MEETIDNNNKLCNNRNDNDNDSDNIIIRLLEEGLFDYLQTISIIELLTSCHALHQYRGIFNNMIII